MKRELHLSKKSQNFIENLRVYLFSSGKKQDEIEGIVNELEIHLSEAEQNGKSIQKIIGKSPKEYMEMVSDEMTIDYRTWFKYICLIIFGSFSVKIFSDLLAGNLSYSLLEIIGHIIITVLFITVVFKGFKYISTINQSNVKEGVLIFGIALLPLVLFLGLTFLDKVIWTPTVHFDNIGSLIIGGITLLFVIGISVWAKTWILIVITALLTLPEYFLNLTSLQYETQHILSMIISFAGIAVSFWILPKLENVSEN
ncbi:HAAS domain-containing protein [Pontibacillus litoralis]|uniref:HAAS transmembrane region domain-containing protein n=1 Tax=Pontibacillus litoralis JSM 072002 TaxID=1385512 RepID=A0A0A5G8M8_9BACI|nr:hypothetical protein [Pontibacillus litoralis]KGX87503.1 hypothetical protein N784_14755 [Pontibacillus litoralis JSM 072002]